MIAPGDIRLLLTDVDGTLVNRDKVVSEAARAAVRALRAKGVDIAITSARPPRGLRMLVEPLDLKLPIAGFNGGLVTNPDLSVIERHPIDAGAARRIVDMLQGQGLDVWVYTETEWFVPDAKGAHVDREAWILKFDPIVVAKYTEAQLSAAYKIVGVSDDLDLVGRCEPAAQALLGKTASATRSEAHFLDVTNPLATKGQVVASLAKRLNISPHQIATIGDMPNDVLMFKPSGFSIAMGNASDAVKGQASAVTDTNEADGFAKAVQRFLLTSNAA